MSAMALCARRQVQTLGVYFARVGRRQPMLLARVVLPLVDSPQRSCGYVRQRIDVEDEALIDLLGPAPFVHRNSEQYGLVSRDVSGGHETIAGALDRVVVVLESEQRGLSAEQATELVRDRAAGGQLHAVMANRARLQASPVGAPQLPPHALETAADADRFLSHEAHSPDAIMAGTSRPMQRGSAATDSAIGPAPG